MATLQERNGSFRVLFVWRGKRDSFTLGKIPQGEAEAKVSQVDYLLMRLKQGFFDLPPGIGVIEFLQKDGKVEFAPATSTKRLSLGEMRDQYLATHEPSLEATTVDGIKLHFKHLCSALGEGFPVYELSLADLQGYVDRRTKAKGANGRRLSPATIKKEIVSLRTMWNWAVRMKWLSGPFPQEGLRYPKGHEKPPFMTFAEIERRVGTGEISRAEEAELWASLYLTIDEAQNLLKDVKKRPAQPFVYPAVAFAAHTGARRSEIIRVQTNDVDLDAGTVLIREKKKARGRLTTRRVPLTAFLHSVLSDWLDLHPGGQFLFCHQATVKRSKKRSETTGWSSVDRPTTGAARTALVQPRSIPVDRRLTVDEAHNHLQRILDDTKWKNVRGWHVFRHSFISACAVKNVDQRFIDEWVGHQSEQQRKRYRHLAPSTQSEVLAAVFK